MKIFKNVNLNGEITDIISENGIITDIKKTDASGIDFKGQTIRAGLIDIHTHGAIGYDTMDGNISETAIFYAKNGVTTFYPTTMTVDIENIKNVINKPINKTDGANIPGYHLEGPYINEKYKGAQNSIYIRKPDINEFNSFENVKIVTIAPETDDAFEFIKKCDAVVSLGHSDSDYDTAIKAIENGAMCLTHTFNAMPPLHHRNPSLIGAASDKNIYVQVICDGLHIHSAVIRMLYKIFGSDRMILISDSMRATGLSDGEYEFGGQTITVSNGVARTPDGAIAGSTSTLIQCVNKAIEFGIPSDEAYKMASETPAKLMGVNKGIIKKGYDCDFIILDENGKLTATVVGGNLV